MLRLVASRSSMLRTPSLHLGCQAWRRGMALPTPRKATAVMTGQNWLQDQLDPGDVDFSDFNDETIRADAQRMYDALMKPVSEIEFLGKRKAENPFEGLREAPVDYDVFMAEFSETSDEALGMLMMAQAMQRKAELIFPTIKRFEDDGHEVTNLVYLAAIRAFSCAGDARGLLKAFNLLKERYDSPSDVPEDVYFGLVTGLIRSKQLPIALGLLNQMNENGIQPSQPTYGALISACVKSDNTPTAWELYEHMVAIEGHEPDLATYNTMIAACAKDLRPEKAVSMLAEMQRHEVDPTDLTLSAVMSACASRRDTAADAFFYFQKLVAEGYPVSQSIFNVLIKACGTKADISRAEGLLLEMQEAGHSPSFRTYMSLISTYSNAFLAGPRPMEPISVTPALIEEVQAPFSDDDVDPVPKGPVWLGDRPLTQLDLEHPGDTMPEFKGPAAMRRAETDFADLPKHEVTKRLQRVAEMYSSPKDLIPRDIKRPPIDNREAPVVPLGEPVRELTTEESGAFRGKALKKCKEYYEKGLECLKQEKLPPSARDSLVNNLFSCYTRSRSHHLVESAWDGALFNATTVPDKRAYTLYMTHLTHAKKAEKAEMVLRDMREGGLQIGEPLHCQMVNMYARKKDADGALKYLQRLKEEEGLVLSRDRLHAMRMFCKEERDRTGSDVVLRKYHALTTPSFWEKDLEARRRQRDMRGIRPRKTYRPRRRSAGSFMRDFPGWIGK